MISGTYITTLFIKTLRTCLERPQSFPAIPEDPKDPYQAQYEAIIDAAMSTILPHARINPQSTEIPSPFSFLKRAFFAEGVSDAHFSLKSQELSLEADYLMPNVTEGRLYAKDLISQCIDRLPADFFSDMYENKERDYFKLQESLLSLLHRYLALVAAGDQGESLYDYIRLSIAYATCLLHNQQADADQFDPTDSLLVKADLSGIQSFIFDVVSKGVAKSLKARSLKVQILSMLTARYILEQLGLSPANLLFIGGGNFYLLIPASQEDALHKIRQDITAGALERHSQGLDFVIPEQLQVYLGSTLIRKEDFQHFGPKWQEVDNDLIKQRTQPYREAKAETLFAPIPSTNQTWRRDAEKVFYMDTAKRLNVFAGFELNRNHSTAWTEPWTPKQSRNVHQESVESFSSIKDSSVPHPYSFAQQTLRLSAYEWEADQQKRNNALATVHTFINDDTKYFTWEKEIFQVPTPFIFLVRKLPVWNRLTADGANLAAWLTIHKEFIGDADRVRSERAKEELSEPTDGNIISFSQLGMKAWHRTGTDKLGVLKMDIDDLGRLFQHKLQATCNSIAHTAAMSRSLKWIFEGYMNSLLDTPLVDLLHDMPGPYKKKLEAFPDETFRDNLYTVFSGGDDLMIVGAWDIVLEFARLFREKLSEMSKGAVSISAGVVIVSSRYPISRFAELSEDALDQAKKFGASLGKDYASEIEDQRYAPKGRISVMGQVLDWDRFEAARDLAHTLYHLVEEGESKAVIQKVRKSMVGYEAVQRQILKRQRLSFPRMWRLGYYLRDVGKGSDERKKGRVQQIVQVKILNTYKQMYYDLLLHQAQFDGPTPIPPNPAFIGVAARWAEFLLRNHEKSNK